MDWMAIVQERGEVTTKLAREVPPILARADLTDGEVSALFNAVNKHCETVEDMMDRMSDDDSVNEHLMEAAEALEEICNDLTEAIANRLAEIRLAGR